MTVLAGLGPERVSESAVAEMLVRHIQLVSLAGSRFRSERQLVKSIAVLAGYGARGSFSSQGKPLWGGGGEGLGARPARAAPARGI